MTNSNDDKDKVGAWIKRGAQPIAAPTDLRPNNTVIVGPIGGTTGEGSAPIGVRSLAEAAERTDPRTRVEIEVTDFEAPLSSRSPKTSRAIVETRFAAGEPGAILDHFSEPGLVHNTRFAEGQGRDAIGESPIVQMRLRRHVTEQILRRLREPDQLAALGDPGARAQMRADIEHTIDVLQRIARRVDTPTLES